LAGGREVSTAYNKEGNTRREMREESRGNVNLTLNNVIIALNLMAKNI
jgi:hypothetical protein